MKRSRYLLLCGLLVSASCNWTRPLGSPASEAETPLVSRGNTAPLSGNTAQRFDWVEPTRRPTRNQSALAIPFQENKGQWSSHVAFRADSFAGAVWVTEDAQLVYSLLSPQNQNGVSILGAVPDLVDDDTRQTQVSESMPSFETFAVPSANSVTLSVPAQNGSRLNWTLVEQFVGGHAGLPRGLERTRTNVSYFLGADSTKWAPLVATFGAVTLGEVWPHIEVRLMARGNNVEKFFFVAPNADPALIEMSLSGAESLRLADQALVVRTGLGEVRFSPPVAFQEVDGERRVVEVRYRLTQSGYGFELGPYDARLELVIDPVLQSTFLGGAGLEGAELAVTPEASGNILVSGFTSSSNFPGTTGGAQFTLAAGRDIFVARLSGDLTTLIQTTYLGGAGSDVTQGAPRVDVNGDIFIVGDTDSVDFPATIGGGQPTLRGGTDCVVTKLNSALTGLIQSTYLGGSSTDRCRGDLAFVVASSQVAIGGFTQSANLPARAGGAQSVFGGGVSDLFAALVTSDLTTLTRTTYVGGSGVETGSGSPVLDSAGNLVLLGTSGGGFPGTLGGAQPGLGGGNDLVVARLDPTLTSLLQSTYIGGSQNEGASGGVAISSTGEVILSGATSSVDFPGTAGGAQPAYSAPGMSATDDFVVVRLSSDLTALLQSTYFGGVGVERSGGSPLILPSGDIVVSGVTEGFSSATVGGAVPSTDGLFSTIVVRFNPQLTALAQATLIGETGPINRIMMDPANTGQRGLALDGAGNLLVSGIAVSDNYPGVLGGAQSTFGGMTDVAITRLTPDLQGCAASSECVNGTGEPIFGYVAGQARNLCTARVCVACRSDSDCDDSNACTTNSCFRQIPATANCVVSNLNSGTQCRASLGTCDTAETCPGFGAPCPMDSFAAAGLVCAAQRVCNGTGTCVRCIAPSDCDDGNPCTINTCASNMCQSMNANAGVSCGASLVCDGAGSCTGCTDPAQCADGNDCTDDVCTTGVCSNPPVVEGQACSTGFCETNGTPSCVGCTSDVHCSAPSPRCDQGTCVACLANIDCDDGNDCTSDLCAMDQCDHSPVTDGVLCPSGLCMAGVCRPEGCSADTDCSEPTPVCNGTGGCIGCTDGSVPCPLDSVCDPQTGRCGLDPEGDADDDGIRNGIECPALVACPDSDADDIADYLDPDDDGDGKPTRSECPNPAMCLDTDRDGSANYLDTDDDGDGIRSADEVSDGVLYNRSDADLDGAANCIDTDSDGDGSSDRVEGRNLSPEQIPYYLDVNYLGGGALAGGAMRCAVSPGRPDGGHFVWVLAVLSYLSLRRRRAKAPINTNAA